MKNDLIQKIRNNVNNYIEIRKLAQQESINYGIARIMYNDGKKDIELSLAKDIYEKAKEYKVPYYLIQSIVLNSGYSVSDIREFDVDYELELYVEGRNEEVDKLKVWYDYEKKIRSYMKQGLSFEVADKLMKLKIDLYAKLHKVSKTVSTLICVCNMDIEGAQKYNEVLDYFKKGNFDFGSIKIYNLISYLKNSKNFKEKKNHGITLISKTDEGLKKLEDMVNKAFDEGSDDYKKALYDQSVAEGLCVTDFCFNSCSCCYSYYSLIYMDIENRTLDSIVKTFYHESSHFLDYVLSQNKGNFHSVVESKVGVVFEKIRKEVSNTPVGRIIDNKNIPLSIRNLLNVAKSKLDFHLAAKGISHYYFSKIMKRKYVSDDKMQLKWRNEIDEEFHDYSETQREALFRQKVNQEAKKYSILIGSILDIYDGLAKGKLYSYFGTTGHGKEYYSDNDNTLIEFIADVGAIYNSDGIDLLEFELGSELANEVIQIYKDMIRENDKKSSSNINTDSDKMNEVAINNAPIKKSNKKISLLRYIRNYLEKDYNINNGNKVGKSK